MTRKKNDHEADIHSEGVAQGAGMPAEEPAGEESGAHGKRAGVKHLQEELKAREEEIKSLNDRLLRTLADGFGCNVDVEFTADIIPGYPEPDFRIHLLQCRPQPAYRTAAAGGYAAAICAAPKVLADAGLLDGRQATGYPGVLDRLNLPRTELLHRAVVTDGRVVTSRGPGTAMDFALELIERLLGKTKRDEVEAPLVRP